MSQPEERRYLKTAITGSTLLAMPRSKLEVVGMVGAWLGGEKHFCLIAGTDVFSSPCRFEMTRDDLLNLQKLFEESDQRLDREKGSKDDIQRN
jgi:hypothetical protein